MASLDPETLDVLDEFLRDRAPKVRSRVVQAGLDQLPADVRRELTDLLADELLTTGFDSNWRPNKRGLALECLIDLVCINDDDSDA